MASASYWLYVGCYTMRGSKGMSITRFDAGAGSFGRVNVAAELPNPTFQTVHPNRRVLYSVSEVRDATGRHGGSVHAFAIDGYSGALTFLNRQSSEGAGPCHVSIDSAGRYVMTANYSSGGAAIFPVEKGGRLAPPSGVVQHSGSGPDPKRQQGPHAHSATPTPDDRFILVADLGLDRVMIYRNDEGRLVASEPPFAAVPPGAGPRHVAFHPTLPMLYVVNEMGNSVTAFSYDKTGCALREQQTLTTLPEGFEEENTGADIHIHPNGRFLYASNRGHDSIAQFAIAADGALTPAGWHPTLGRCPRNFALDPTGAWMLVAHQESDTIVLFRVDPASGALVATGRACEVSMPVCLTMIPAP